jgi:hypothetical protein
MLKSYILGTLTVVLFTPLGLGQDQETRITVSEESRFPVLPLSSIWNSDIKAYSSEMEIDFKILTSPATAILNTTQWPSAIGSVMNVVTLPTEGAKREIGFISSQPWAKDPLKSSLLLSGGKFWKPELMPTLPPMGGVVLLDFFSISPREAIEPMIYAAKDLKTLVLPFGGSPRIDWGNVSPSLERLYLFNVTFTRVELEFLRQFTKLKSLFFHKCRLSYEDTLAYVRSDKSQPSSFPVWNSALTKLSMLECEPILQVILKSYAYPHVQELTATYRTVFFPPKEHWKTKLPKLQKVHLVMKPPPLEVVSDESKRESAKNFSRQLRLYVVPKVPPDSNCEFIIHCQDF